MAGQSFLRRVAGVLTEVLGIQASAGAGDAGKIPALDAAGRLDASMMPTGVGAEVVVCVTSEALSAGQFVNLYNNTGTLTCRKADASAAGKEANGFVLSAYASSASATVYLPSQTNTQLTGLTPGTTHYLDPATPGGATATPPTGTGKVSQVIGKSLTATSMVFQPSDPITLAS